MDGVAREALASRGLMPQRSRRSQPEFGVGGRPRIRFGKMQVVSEPTDGEVTLGVVALGDDLVDSAGHVHVSSLPSGR